MKAKKVQNAASRKDSFYKRAKEQGYRARSSYKLMHLNNLHGFLKKAKVCIDLCAAPGSWMQVAREFMPSGSVIVGVDLFAIKPIPGTISIKGDITTESLRSELRTTLKTFKADVVLHDGAPNVGCNWTQDSYDQNVLVLHAFKLACEFLRFGGDFVTKVFRCKDSNNLEFVFKSLFKSVEITKPQASRHESAEIFYVCRSYKLKPGDKADPKFFDPREVFKEVALTQASKINLHKPEKVPRQAQGYEDGAEILFKTVTITEFITSNNYEELLQKSSALLFDDNRWSNHPHTTSEIRACCVDIKVLGRKEIRLLLAWRKTLKTEYDADKKALAETEEFPVGKLPEEDDMDELDKVDQEIKELEKAAAKDDKKKQRAIRKQRRMLQQKLKMIAMNNNTTQDSDEFFRLQEMEKVNDQELLMLQYDCISSDDDTGQIPRLQRYKKGDFELDESGKNYRLMGEESDTDPEEEARDEDIFDGKKKKGNLKKVDGIEIAPKEEYKKSVRFAGDDSDASSDDSDDEGQEGAAQKRKRPEGADDSDSDYDSDDEEGAERLTTDLVGDVVAEKRERRAESWFSQEIFENLDSDADEDLEVDAAVSRYQKIGGRVRGEASPALADVQNLEEQPETAQNSATNADDESKPEESSAAAAGKKKIPLRIWLSVLQSIIEKSQTCAPKYVCTPSVNCKQPAETTVADINTVDMSDWGHDTNDLTAGEQFPPLTPAGLALAAQIIKTKKARRDFGLEGWNRYMTAPEEAMCLPEWFQEDETAHMQPVFNVPEEDVRFYTARDKAVNARTVKKVQEAKARKQRRFKKIMQNVMKKAEATQGSSLMSQKEKQDEIKNIYKKAMKSRVKKETQYIYMKKGDKGKKPKGIKGKIKMVDSRMKHDVRIKMRDLKKRKTVGRGGKKKK